LKLQVMTKRAEQVFLQPPLLTSNLFMQHNIPSDTTVSACRLCKISLNLQLLPAYSSRIKVGIYCANLRSPTWCLLQQHLSQLHVYYSKDQSHEI